MEKFTVEQYTEAKAAAKELGINPVGKSKQVLVDLVNAAIDAQNNSEMVAEVEVEAPKAKKPAARTLEDYNLTEGEMVVINGRPLNFGSKTVLTNRRAQVVKASKVDGYIKAHLVNEKNGELQKCEIALPIESISKIEAQDETVVA